MNCVWEIALKAGENGYALEDLRFINSTSPSPYTESSFDFLNTDRIEESTVEVNPLYRFPVQLGELFLADVTGYERVRELFLDVMLHYVAVWDLRSGADKKELRARYLLKEIESGRFLQCFKEVLLSLPADKAKIMMFYLLDLYRCGDYITAFKKAVRELYPRANLYIHGENSRKLILFTGVNETEEEKKKVKMLVQMFLPIACSIDIFWKYHFGIVGVEESMKIGTIAVY